MNKILHNIRIAKIYFLRILENLTPWDVVRMKLLESALAYSPQTSDVIVGTEIGIRFKP
jgi:hypothetical protein